MSENHLFSYPTKSIEFNFGNKNGLDHISALVERDGLAQYEYPTPGILVELAQQTSGLILDIGANTGIMTLLMAAANTEARIFAFEPLATVRQILRDNISANPNLSSKICVQDYGLSNKEGEFKFYETINNMGLVTTSSSLELRHAESVGEYKEHSIKTKTLDAWASGLDGGEVGLMKVDVEGHEYAVLEGGRRTINKDRPYIVIEVLDQDFAPLNKFRLECRYIDFAISATHLTYQGSTTFNPDAWNHLFCPAEKAGRIFSLVKILGLQLKVS